MSTIVVGYVPNALGEAAVAEAVEEARRRDAELVVINTTRADRLVNPAYADSEDVSKLEAMLSAAGVPYSIRHSISEATAAEEVVDTAAELAAFGLHLAVVRKRRGRLWFQGDRRPVAQR